MRDLKKTANPLPEGLQTLVAAILRLRKYLAFRYTNFFLYGLVLFLVLWIPSTAGQEQVVEGQVATRDIIAPETVEIVDFQRTEDRKQRILADLPPVYVVDQQAVNEARDEIERVFQDLDQFRSDPSSDGELQATIRTRYQMTDRLWEWFTGSPSERYVAMQGIFFNFFDRFVSQPVREDELSEILLQVSFDLESLDLDPDEHQAIIFLMTRFLTPNAQVDPLLTEVEHSRILSEVEPVKRLIQKGQTLLRQGDIAGRETMEILRALGIAGKRFEYTHLAVLALIVFLTVLFEFLFIRKFSPELLDDNSLLLIRIVSVLGIFLISHFALRVSWYFIMLGAIPLILHSLVGRSFALGECLTLLPLMVWAEQMDFLQAYYLCINLLLPLLVLGPTIKRQDLVRAGFLLAIANIVFSILFGLQEALGAMAVFSHVLFGAGGGIGASVLALGGISLFENTFNLSTDIRLFELLNPTHPLLKRLMMEAPGTYSHSLVVANLAEAAAEQVGANTLLARTGAYYHDIGKLKRPYFFIENQIGSKNIHNRLSPNLSSLIIQNHVKDGVDIARRNKLPREIQEIVARHHGTNLIRYFFEKALRERRDPVQEGEFRYAGPHPRTPEEVLIFLADSVEAAVRCMARPTSSRIETVVNNILQMYLKDNQLDESRLTLRDLHTINRTFVIVLSGMVHSRVPYPENGASGKKPGSPDSRETET